MKMRYAHKTGANLKSFDSKENDMTSAQSSTQPQPTPATRPLRCTSCDPPRKFKAKQDLAAHILSKHGCITLKQRQRLRRAASALSFCDDSPILNGGAVRKRRRRNYTSTTATHRKNTCVTICTQKQPAATAIATSEIAIAAIPSRKPLVLDFAQGLF